MAAAVLWTELGAERARAIAIRPGGDWGGVEGVQFAQEARGALLWAGSGSGKGAARWWRGHAACGTGTSRGGDVRAEEARGRSWGVQGWRGRVPAVGRASGGRVPAGVALVRARTQGARPGVGRQCSGECGQGEGAWCKGSTWGGSGGQGPAPGHGVPLVYLLGDQVSMVVAMSMAWLLRLGFRAWGC